MRLIRYWLLRGWLLLLPLTAAACSTTKLVPVPAPPAAPVIANVLVPVPCEVAQVQPTQDPAVRARKGDDVFTLTKLALASRLAWQGEATELRAANDQPCPK